MLMTPGPTEVPERVLNVMSRPISMNTISLLQPWSTVRLLTGVLNDLIDILTDLKENNIITIVDAVSSLRGTSVLIENIDICIGGSQKYLSSPS